MWWRKCRVGFGWASSDWPCQNTPKHTDLTSRCTQQREPEANTFYPSITHLVSSSLQNEHQCYCTIDSFPNVIWWFYVISCFYSQLYMCFTHPLILTGTVQNKHIMLHKVKTQCSTVSNWYNMGGHIKLNADGHNFKQTHPYFTATKHISRHTSHTVHTRGRNYSV